MKTQHQKISYLRNILFVMMSLLISFKSFAAVTELANGPFVSSSTVQAKPNILYILDDSGSMSWDFLPDWADDTHPMKGLSYTTFPELKANSGFNSIAYNPTITYTPPTFYNSDGTVNTSTYKSMTAANTSNWTAVKNDAYLSTATSNLVNNAYYYFFTPGEYCTSEKLKTCSVQSSPSPTYPYPAGLRWCKSTAFAVCQGLWYSGSYIYPKYPSPAYTKITISGTASTSVSGITVNGTQIMSAAVAATTSYATLASNIVTAINNCTTTSTGNCGLSGYSATYTTTTAGGGSATILINAPSSLGNITFTPVVTQSGTMAITPSAFLGYSPGSNTRVNIVSTNNSYPAPNSISKAIGRTDCAGTTCTYAEEMTNYANYWAYYRTRMQMMKTAMSIAFAPIDSKYRVGYASLNGNNANSKDFLNIADFSSTQKFNWYTSVFAAKLNNSTALRPALSKAGRMYAGKESTWNTVTVTDPVQYSCQQNFTIMSTDGYWNGGAGYKLDGSTAVGNQDAFEPRPLNDGGVVTYVMSTSQTSMNQTQIVTSTSQTQQRTTQIQTSTNHLQQQSSQLQSRTGQLQSQTSQLQSKTSQLQSKTIPLSKLSQTLQTRTRTLQKQTSQLQRRTSQLQTQTSQLQKQTTQLQSQTSQLQTRTYNLQKQTSQLQTRTTPLQVNTSLVQQATSTAVVAGVVTWGPWTTVSSCTWKTTGTGATSRQKCQYLSYSGFTNATGTCTVVAQATSTANNAVWPTSYQCQYGTTSAWSNYASTSCTTAAQSTASPYTVVTARDCQTVVSVPFADTSSTCTVTTAPNASGQTTQCQYGTVSAWSGTGSCTTAAKSTASPYTVTVARDCQTVITSPFADTSSTCTVTTTPDSSGNTTQCQYGTASSWSGASSCTTVAKSTASPYTVTTAVGCQTVVTSAFANTSSTCTATTTPDSSGNTTQCQYSTPTAWAASPTCTSLAQSTSSPYTVTTATDCQSVVTSAFANTASTCTVTTTPDASGNTTQCQYGTPTAWAGVASCAAVAESTASPYTVVTSRECQTITTATATNQATCLSTTPASNGTFTSCAYDTSAAFVGAATCTAKAQSTANPYTGPAVQCQTIDTTSFANASSCTSTSPNSSGNFTVCQYTPYTAFSNASSCTAVSQSASSPYTVGTAVNCQYVYGAWTGTGSCTPVNPSTSSPYTVANPVQCQTAVTSAYSDVSSCTTSAVDSGGNSIQCRYAPTNYVNSSSCTPITGSSGSPYTVPVEVLCQTTDTGWVGVPSCTTSASGGQIVTCQTLTSSNPAASCTATAASSGNGYTTTTCATNTVTPDTFVASCTNVSPTASNNYVKTTCNTATSTTTVNSCTAQAPAASNSYLTINCSAPTITGGYSDTLADVAEYYYMTDLRTSTLGNCTSGSSGEKLCSSDSPDPYNNVPTSGLDSNSSQHMTTFTLGLGIPGYMLFNPNYASMTSGDFYDVKLGTLADGGETCPWLSSGAKCNWPQPASDSQSNIDDLWHAALNGRGSYFSAGNPSLLITGLSNALAGISTRTGSASSASTSNPNVSAGDNFIFSSTFTTQEWVGELTRRQIDVNTLKVSSAIDWSAQALLDSKDYTTRKIYTFDSSATNKLKEFKWANLTTTEQAYFTTPYISSLSQFCTSGATCLNSTAVTNASGQNLVNYLLGDRTNEGDITDTSKYYRTRTHILGDIVSSQATYVAKPKFSYGDFGYASYISTNSNRTPVIYVAANDGMLHGFYADSSTGVAAGTEAWSYIPSPMLPKLYNLADKNYTNLHQYFVDGSPVAGDICISNCGSNNAVWRTILVGGYNGGGRGFYALDVTNPAVPKALWEFTDTNLGYSFGNPRITKLKNGTWVVILTSGYNNVSPGDGVGRIYILNAATGTPYNAINGNGIISTGYGSTTNPSGLSKLTVSVTSNTDNTAEDIYGGDLYGNLWRFDVNNDIGASGYDAHLLAVLTDSSNNRQPITTKPVPALVDGYKVVYVGTGKMLGISDLSNTSQQSFYAIKDTGGVNTYNTPRTVSNNFVKQTITVSTCPTGSSADICSAGQVTRTGSSNTVSFASNNGWYFDLPDAGERSNTDPLLASGIIGFTTNVPSATGCTIGGYGYLYFVDYKTGSPIASTKDVVGVRESDSFINGVMAVSNTQTCVESGACQSTSTSFCTTDATGGVQCNSAPPNYIQATTQRLSWRELVDEQ